MYNIIPASDCLRVGFHSGSLSLKQIMVHMKKLVKWKLSYGQLTLAVGDGFVGLELCHNSCECECNSYMGLHYFRKLSYLLMCFS